MKDAVFWLALIVLAYALARVNPSVVVRVGDGTCDCSDVAARPLQMREVR